MKRIWSAGMGGIFAMGLAGCTTAELAAISEGLAQASYDMQYAAYPAYGPVSPYSYGTGTYATSEWVGYNQCVHTGSFYQCDTNGDGYADMFGNAETGEMTSSSLKVNGRGEGFTWSTGCGCWQRDPAYDTARADDGHHHPDHHGRHRD